MNSDKTVVVGMSGGVDSSVTAYLLKKQGYNVIGVTMQTWQDDTEVTEGGCGAPSAIDDARAVAEYLDIPFHVIDFRKEFKEMVIDYFTNEYLAGRTPNPCVVCNRKVKWEALLEAGKNLGAEYVATGHYARIDKLENGRYAVRNSITAAKDQTYALYNLTQDQLIHTLYPIGGFTKEEIRKIAEEAGIPVANKPDSQDICFIPDGDYGAFIRENATDKVKGPGNFVTKEGKVLGKHKGIVNYTIGQRRGLEIAAGHRVFVTGIRPETNEVVIGENEELFVTEVISENPNWMSIEGLKDGEKVRVKAKIRYNHMGEMGYISILPDGKVLCEFDKPVRAATPGQACVFYDGEYVLGGATIV